jgi:regulator of protease activity HflC (stomatin/prohibitin superfamily)
LELKGSNVPDKNGSPLSVSAVVTYKIVDPLASLYNVDQFTSYIRNQGQEVLKRVISRFSYMSDNPNEPSLLDDTMVIGKFEFTQTINF